LLEKFLAKFLRAKVGLDAGAWASKSLAASGQTFTPNTTQTGKSKASQPKKANFPPSLSVQVRDKIWVAQKTRLRAGFSARSSACNNRIYSRYEFREFIAVAKT